MSRALAFSTASLLLLSACAEPPEQAASAEAVEAAPPAGGESAPSAAAIRELLETGQTVIGLQSGEHTAEQGESIVQTPDADFVFYSLESGPWDMEALEAYRAGMEQGAASGEGLAPHPILLRIPPIRELGEEETRTRVQEALDHGAAGIVYPHVMDREEAELAVDALGGGEAVNVLLIEDQESVARAEEIVTTPGADVVIPGPGDLSRAYEGDAEATEEAIQSVLAACLEHDVPCGITAGADDIAERIDQGFRFFIVRGDDVVEAGRTAAGRTN